MLFTRVQVLQLVFSTMLIIKLFIYNNKALYFAFNFILLNVQLTSIDLYCTVESLKSTHLNLLREILPFHSILPELIYQTVIANARPEHILPQNAEISYFCFLVYLILVKFVTRTARSICPNF